jgi:hypothetical protein
VTTHIRHLCIDCADPYALATFWSEALGYPMRANAFGDEQCAIDLPEGNHPRLIVFTKVPEAKVVKNRLHLDIAPVERTLAEEVARLEAIGATVVDRRVGPRGAGWIVMHDVGGNEFCVESNDAEIAEARARKAAEEAR